jgi:hypothetical protein
MELCNEIMISICLGIYMSLSQLLDEQVILRDHLGWSLIAVMSLNLLSNIILVIYRGAGPPCSKLWKKWQQR